MRCNVRSSLLRRSRPCGVTSNRRGVSAHIARAMHVECEQHTDRKLLEAWITLHRLDRALRGIEIPRHPVGAIDHGVFHELGLVVLGDRKSTRLNSSHSQISYAVFCLKKKKHRNK